MSATKQGFYSKVKLTPRLFRHIMNLWPPFWGTRIHIIDIGDDWKTLKVRMKLGLRNKNYVGSHFGGGLFVMTDAFYMIMLMNILGRDYLVWDKSANIEFIAPGRTTVYAEFHVTDAMLTDIKSKTEQGAKFEPVYRIDIVGTDGKLVARVDKTLYIRKKRPE